MKSFFVKLGKIRRLLKKSGIKGGFKVLSHYVFTFIKAFFVGGGDVLFISSGVGDSAYYRAYNPAEELRIHGFKSSTTISDNPILPRLVDKFKVFVFHRAVYNKNIEKMIEKIKEQKKEIIFDTDDLVYDPQYLMHMDYFKKMSKAEQEQYKNGIGAEIVNDPYVKVCTTTVSYLADRLREKGKRVIVVPNKFSESELELANNIIKKEKFNDGFVRIVYCSGTLSHNKDFVVIKDVLMRVMAEYEKVKLTFIGPLDIPEEFDYLKDRIEVVPYVPRKEVYPNLYKTDINIIPLEQNPFCESKSAIKFTEAGILSLPSIAVRNQTFSEAITDGVDGFLADNSDEWFEKIGKLIEDSNLRKRIGKEARKKVFKFYTNRKSQNFEYYDYIKSRIK